MKPPEFLREYGNLDPQRIAGHLGSRAEWIDGTTQHPAVRRLFSEYNLPSFWTITLYGEMSRRCTTVDISPESSRVSIYVGQEPHIFTYLPTPQTPPTESLYDAQNHADFHLGLEVTRVSYQSVTHTERILKSVQFHRDLGYYEYFLSVDQFGRVNSSLDFNSRLSRNR